MSLKFRNPENGKVYDVTEGSCYGSGFCAKINTCSDCEITTESKKYGYAVGECYDWIKRNPEEAARLMGYDLLQDEERKPQKPPIGLMPEHIWKEQRFNSICHAIGRYVFSGLDPLPEWVDEGRRLMKELEMEEQK